MKTIRKMIAASAAGLLAAAACPLTCSAGSVEDVFEAMRSIGLPESMIQEARNQYENTPHDENGMTINDTYYTYEVWADMVELYEDEIWEEVGKKFGVSGEEIKAASKEQQNQSDPQQTENPEPEKQADLAFINMTLEEKQAYVAALPEEERAAFLAGLTTSERNSIIKQMDTDSQANIASGFIELGEQLGMHVSVDELSGNGISYSVRNEDGTLIDVNAIGNTVDDTGWNTTVPVLLSAVMLLTAAGGIVWLVRKQEDEDNG